MNPLFNTPTPAPAPRGKGRRTAPIQGNDSAALEALNPPQLEGGTIHELPADFRVAIETDPAARRLWADITPLARNEWICWVLSAKKEATRARRIEVGIDKMRGGMRRPCCWPGCPHR